MTRSPTPLELAPDSLADGSRALYLKREDVHELGAFKWRGALPVLAAYRDQVATEVVTASTGNHGAATAWAAAEATIASAAAPATTASTVSRATIA